MEILVCTLFGRCHASNDRSPIMVEENHIERKDIHTKFE